MAFYNREKARRSFFNTVGFRAISQIATMLSYIVLVRGLSEQSFGVLNLLYAVIPVISTVASLGLEQTLRRFQPEYLRIGNAPAAAWLLRVVTVARLASTALIVALVLLGWNVVAPLFQLGAYRADFLFFSVLVLLYFQARILEFAAASHMLHRYSVGSTAIFSITKLVAYLVLAWRHELTLRGAIFADTIAYGLAYVFLLAAYHYNTHAGSTQVAYKPPPEERKRLWRYALFNNFNDAGSILLYVQTDNLFIAALMNPIAVGAYSFYTRLNAMVSNLTPIRLFEAVVQPLFFAIPPEDAAVRAPRYFTLLLNCSLIMQLPIIAYATVYHHEIVAVLFGGKFLEVSWLMAIIFAFGATSNVISLPVTYVAQYEEKAGTILLSQAFGIYQIVAMIALVSVMGLYGAAIATGTFHLFRNLFVWRKVRDRARWLNFRAVATWTGLIWGGAILICYALKAALPPNPIVAMACGGVVCALGVLLYVRSPAICASDRELLGKLFHGREARWMRGLGLLPEPGHVP